MHLLIARINGDVQGRSCRNSITSICRPLGIVGEAINAADGSVRVRAMHDDPAVLEDLRGQLAAVPANNVNYVQSLPIIKADPEWRVPTHFDQG